MFNYLCYLAFLVPTQCSISRYHFHCHKPIAIVDLSMRRRALEPDLRPVTASHFARPGKSAAAAAITLSTQGVNEPQIELLQQTNYSWCILRCFMIYPWVNILSDS